MSDSTPPTLLLLFSPNGLEQKKIWKEIPCAVQKEFLQRLKLSTAENALLPNEDLHIPELLSLTLPSVEPFVSDPNMVQESQREVERNEVQN